MIYTHVRTTVFQEKFSNLTVINMKRFIDKDNCIILNIFAKHEIK